MLAKEDLRVKGVFIRRGCGREGGDSSFKQKKFTHVKFSNTLHTSSKMCHNVTD